MGKFLRSIAALALLYIAFLALHLAPEAVGTGSTQERRLLPKQEVAPAASKPYIEMQWIPPSVPDKVKTPPSVSPTRPPVSPSNLPTPSARMRPRLTCNSTKGAFAVALDVNLCPRSVRQIATMVQAR